MDTINEKVAQAAYDRIADTLRHLRCHGPALCNLSDASAALHWHGARISELHARFRNVG
jgi:hypothetical protein